MRVYDKKQLVKLISEEKQCPKMAQNYRLSPATIVAYDLTGLGLNGPKSLILDQEQGFLLSSASTSSLLRQLLASCPFDLWPLEHLAYDKLGLRDQHVLSLGHYALFSPKALKSGRVDLIALQQVRSIRELDGQMAFVDQNGCRCFLLEYPRTFARARKAAREAIAHNALIGSWLHQTEEFFGCRACIDQRQSKRQLAERSLLDQQLKTGKCLAVKEAADQVRQTCWEDYLHLVGDELWLDEQVGDLDYFWRENRKKHQWHC